MLPQDHHPLHHHQTDLQHAQHQDQRTTVVVIAVVLHSHFLHLQHHGTAISAYQDSHHQRRVFFHSMRNMLNDNMKTTIRSRERSRVILGSGWREFSFANTCWSVRTKRPHTVHGSNFWWCLTKAVSLSSERMVSWARHLRNRVFYLMRSVYSIRSPTFFLRLDIRQRGDMSLQSSYIQGPCIFSRQRMPRSAMNGPKHVITGLHGRPKSPYLEA